MLQINWCCARILLEGNESGVCGNVTQVEAYRADRGVASCLRARERDGL